MTINTETAQLILDAIAWCNKDWMDSLDWESDPEQDLMESRIDFVRFCRDRGIDSVEVKI